MNAKATIAVQMEHAPRERRVEVVPADVRRLSMTVSVRSRSEQVLRPVLTTHARTPAPNWTHRFGGCLRRCCTGRPSAA